MAVILWYCKVIEGFMLSFSVYALNGGFAVPVVTGAPPSVEAEGTVYCLHHNSHHQ